MTLRPVDRIHWPSASSHRSLRQKNENPPPNGQFCSASSRENAVLLALYFRATCHQNGRDFREELLRAVAQWRGSGLRDVPHRCPVFGRQQGTTERNYRGDVTAGAAGLCIPE